MIERNSERPGGGEQDGDLVEWCAGRKFSGRREFTAEERAELEAEARRHGGRVGLFCCGAPLAFVMTMIVLMATMSIMDPHDKNELAGEIATGLMLLLVIPLPVLAFLVAMKSSRWQQEIRQALRAGYVKQFGDSSTESVVEIFPNVSRVWSKNGERPCQDVRALSSLIAPQPEFAAIAARWVGKWQPEGAPNTAHTLRDLSTTERNELRWHSQRVYRRSLLVALLIDSWLFAPIAIAWFTGQRTLFDPAYTWLAVLAVYCNFMLAKAVLLSMKLNRDRRNGVAIVVYVCSEKLRVQQPEDMEFEAVNAPEIEDKSFVIEVLPNIRWLWSFGGKPGRWRGVLTRK